MNKIFTVKEVDGYTFLEYKLGNISIYFSTAEGGLNFNRNTEEGLNNLNNIKKWFSVKNVNYLKQIHSDKIFIGDEYNYEGDALITNEFDRAVGVFTADCVPIILVDEEHNVVAAVHSGWKGTAKNIVAKTIKKMTEDYNTDASKLNVLIGPHIKKCCFEVGEEVIKLFSKDKLFTEEMVINNRYIDLESYILNCLNREGVINKNIVCVNLCTFCASKFKFHSYRKEKQSYGRLFSFAFIKE